MSDHRCVPTKREPAGEGRVNEVCECGAVVRGNVACPHVRQELDHGSVACADCRTVFVRSGVIGEGLDDPGYLLRETREGQR